MKKIEIRISGLGGQGVVLAGQILGRAAVYSGKNAVQTQSYGAEARGSSAKSEVIVSEGKIGFPVVRRCDLLIAMSQEAVDKNVSDLKQDGTLIVDSSIVKRVPQDRKTVEVPATEAAERVLGGRLYANVIMLGALAQIIRVADEESMSKAIEDILPKKASTKNMEAYRLGKQLVGSAPK